MKYVLKVENKTQKYAKHITITVCEEIMKSTTTQKRTAIKAPVVAGKQRNYNEVVDYLDAHWSTNKNDLSLTAIKQLDKAFGSISQQLDTVMVAGTNGKSLTAHFTGKLLREEGLSVGILYSPHILTYNERFSLNNETISNKLFTDIANEVINTAEGSDINVNTLDVLTMMALLYFKNSNVDVAVLELGINSSQNPAHICTPKVVAITRVADPEILTQNDEETKQIIEDIISCVKTDVVVVSADQSKLSLQAMQTRVEERGGTWMMPIRKLAPLVYPFEQLHGRCAALAERVAHTYVNMFSNKHAITVNKSLLSKQKGQRGRPTLEAKRQSELHPKKTIDQFWREIQNSLPGRFQLLDKEKPTILLDNASNLDALKNVLLGARLLHYQRPLKGLTIILGLHNESMNQTELLKTLRYFFKKTSGQIIVCPARPMANEETINPVNIEQITNDIKGMKIKARSAKNLKAALEAARDTVDERNGLVVITGSTAIVAQYWEEKGIKKL